MTNTTETSKQPRYIGRIETAKLIRAALKRAFPAVKFSVRSETYSGGGSIRINWTDGPTTRAVDAIADAFQSSRFDGMIDLGYSVNSWLMPDGTATYASNNGSYGSYGSNPPEHYAKPHPDAELVRFGSGYVFSSREKSPEFVAACNDKWNTMTVNEQSAIINDLPRSLQRPAGDNPLATSPPA